MESRTHARHKGEGNRPTSKKAGSSRWKGVRLLRKRLQTNSHSAPLRGHESEIGRDRGLVRTVTLGAISSSVIKERAASDSQMGLRIWVRMGL